MNQYKDCDLEKGIENILRDFSEETNIDYLTVEKYAEKIIHFAKDIKNNDIEDLENELASLTDEVETLTGYLIDVNNQLVQLVNAFSTVNKKQIKAELQDIIDSIDV